MHVTCNKFILQEKISFAAFYMNYIIVQKYIVGKNMNIINLIKSGMSFTSFACFLCKFIKFDNLQMFN